MEISKVEDFTGTELPNDLILVHEFDDHYSLQARQQMTVDGNMDL